MDSTILVSFSFCLPPLLPLPPPNSPLTFSFMPAHPAPSIDRAGLLPSATFLAPVTAAIMPGPPPRRPPAHWLPPPPGGGPPPRRAVRRARPPAPAAAPLPAPPAARPAAAAASAPSATVALGLRRRSARPWSESVRASTLLLT